MDFKKKHWIFLFLMLLVCPQFAYAADLDVTGLSLWWGFPFAAILLSMAIVPIVNPIFWHHHYGKVIAFWALSFLIPFTYFFGIQASLASLVHVLLAEYLPFVILLSALFVVAGGIYIQVDVKGTPWVNAAFLVIGGCLASLMGTTGASMLLIRPLLRANAHRHYRVHTIVFFIFIVSNIGGSLTPLGDPPLFLGFLKGVDFFWTFKHLWAETLFLISMLLILYLIIDFWAVSSERKKGVGQSPENVVDTEKTKFSVTGQFNFILLFCVVGLVLMSGVWKTDIVFDILGTKVGLPGLVRDIGLVAVICCSLRMTKKETRSLNEFDWAPMKEVGKLFAGIFLTIIPVIAMLRAGTEGAFAPVVAAVTDTAGEPIPFMYFWATGLLSSFLDNAPTYLVFFNTASGDAGILMTSMSKTLMAISAGAVFMGANTYIGNAPNLIVKAIADGAGVRMPSFFGYMAWSVGILLPLLLITSLIWYR